MLTFKQIALNLKRTNDKVTKLTKELAGLKQLKVKLSADLKKAKDSAPKTKKKAKKR